jgi:Ca-activated chloride channel family protein
MKIDPEKDLYAVIGVSAQAAQEEIKRAYRELARRFHPDSRSEVASAKRFQEVQEAYRVLGDPLRRRAYDRQRAERGLGAQIALAWDVLRSREKLPAIPEEQMFYFLVEIRPVGGARTQRLPLNLCLVIDCSTSMQGDRLDYVKAAAHQIIDDMDERDTLGIVSFSDRADILMPSQPLGDRARVHARVSSIWASGGTEIFQGLSAGVKQLHRFHRADVVTHLILLTDGRTYGDEDLCIAEARRAGLERIGISALGIGEDWNDDFLDDLVSQAGGACFYISYPQQVREVLREQVRGLGAIFARDLCLTLRFNGDARLDSAFRVEPFIERLVPVDDVLGLGMLQSGMPVRVLVETVVGQMSPGRHRLVQLDLTAEVPALERRERLVSDLEVDLLDDPPEEPVPSAIVNCLSQLSIFRMQEQAWQALESGRREEAGQRLEMIATRLLDMGEKELAQMALLEAGRVAQGGRVSEKGHKAIKYGTRGLAMKG